MNIGIKKEGEMERQEEKQKTRRIEDGWSNAGGEMEEGLDGWRKKQKTNGKKREKEKKR